MHEKAVLMDEWHLNWWLPPNYESDDLEKLRDYFNSDLWRQAIETAVNNLIQQTPVLKQLRVTVSK